MWQTTKANLKLTYHVFVAAAKEFGNDKVGRMAAAVAYRSMFALAPLFLLAVWVFGLVLGGDTEAEEQILDRITAFAGKTVGEALTTFIDSVKVSGDTAALLGLGLLVWTASSLFMEMQSDLNDIFHVPDEKIEGVMAFVRKRTLGFLWVLGIGVALIAVWAMNAIWRFFGDEILPPDWIYLHDVIGWLTPLVSVILLPMVLGFFFQTMTAVKVRWQAIWWGSFFTSVAFLAAAYGAGLYFSFDDQTSASQVAASIFVILLLTFILSTVFFYGAEVTKVIHDYLVMGDVMAPEARAKARTSDLAVSPPEPDHSVPATALFAFLGGLVIGLWRRR